MLNSTQDTDTFDYAGLFKAAFAEFDKHPGDLQDGYDAADAYLRTRIEAAFVPVERHARELFDATAHGELKTLEALARAEEMAIENELLRETLHWIAVEAENTIPPDGEEAAFNALEHILKLIAPHRKFK